MSTVEEILEAARSLPRPDRAYLLRELTVTLDDSEDDPRDVEAAWAAEIERRYDQVVNGSARMIDLDELRAHIAARRASK